MTDDARDELEALLAQALGTATAALSVQAALAATLVHKKVLTVDEAATLSGLAEVVSGAFQLPPEAQKQADAALSGFAQMMTKLRSRH